MALRRLLPLVAGFLWLGLPALHAQTPPDAPPNPQPAAEEPAGETFYEAIQVHVAEIDVVVTDRSGRRITGLTREDFTLFEDGVPVEITSFAALSPGAPPAPAPPPTATAEPAADAGIASVTPQDEGMLLAILVDGHGVDPTMRQHLLPAVRRFLAEDVRPSDRLLVATPTPGGSLRILLPLSTDRSAAAAAVEDSLASGTGGPAATDARTLVMELERALPPPINPEAGTDQIAFAESEARRLYEDIQRYGERAHRQTVANGEALEELVEGLAGMPGRKAVLVVGGGIMLRPARALYGAWRNRFGGAGADWQFASPFDAHAEDAEINAILGRVAAHANGNRVTIYALGSEGVPARTGAELRTADVWTAQEAAEAWADVRQSLQMIVGPTGGRSSLDPQSALLRELREDFDAYYSLAYTPKPVRGGKTRNVRVEVSRPGLVVRHRLEVRDRSGRDMMIERTRAALLLGWQDNPLGLGVELGPPMPDERKGVTQLPITVTMPLSNVVLLPRGAFHEGRLTLYLATADEAGGSSPVTEVALPVRVPNDQLATALGQHLGYRTRLGVRTERQRLAVSIRDELGNVSATMLVEPGAADPTSGEPVARDGR